MNSKSIILLLLTMLIASTAASAVDIGVEQIKQMISQSAENLSTYTYSRSSDSSALYSNATLEKKLEVFKTTEGKVDLQKNSAWWGSKLATLKNGKSLNWQNYFVNGSSYLNIGENWTRLDFNNVSRINYDFNEIPGEIALIKNSDMKLGGTEKIGGKDYYKLVGKPNDVIIQAIIGRQLSSALFASPIDLPKELKNQTINLSKSDLINKSNVVVTAWISKDSSLLKRIDVNSSSIITPQMLDIPLTDFKIETSLNESTVYSNFGSPVKIDLPKDAQNESSLLKGAAWSGAVLGIVNSSMELR